MIDISVSEGIARVHVTKNLSKDDFARLQHEVDSRVGSEDEVNGLLIESQELPHWDSLAALSAHLKFIHNHHKKLKAVAIVSDAASNSLLKLLPQHFVKAQIKVFPSNQQQAASLWIMTEAGTAML
ncbi:STAS/SEC14 domain-containing protein [Alginatibacterium sediminis]|uniref:STAS/SEC14 domain-containing protein n=1 Tax=Alginatibacterium sediminis TaxID=2164068 RepID=A0A420EHQ2_9ALTE|nr:STAS/SEC14 domain-containing protein [Alginatibacterium sediminis]RKF20229.1 STAS/SEC14 domain-containing protein [Alginatibacterium sediminis]